MTNHSGPCREANKVIGGELHKHFCCFKIGLRRMIWVIQSFPSIVSSSFFFLCVPRVETRCPQPHSMPALCYTTSCDDLPLSLAGWLSWWAGGTAFEGRGLPRGSPASRLLQPLPGVLFRHSVLSSHLRITSWRGQPHRLSNEWHLCPGGLLSLCCLTCTSQPLLITWIFSNLYMLCC